MTDRGLSFGSVAERYERYRAGYPAAAVDLVLAHRPVDALEVGAGTGKATREIAGRGVRVTALEPDPGMAAVLRRTTRGLPVTVVESPFEGADGVAPVDLLYAAAAFHWTDPATRWDRAASLLRPGGRFANLGGPIDVADPDLAAAIKRLRTETLGDERASGVRDSDDGTRWPGNELTASPHFTDVTVHDLTERYALPADDLVGQLSTVSAFLVQPADVRDALLARIRALLPDPVEVRRDVTVHLATRVQHGPTMRHGL